MPVEYDNVTRSECLREHNALREQDRIESEHISQSLNDLSSSIDKLWDAIEKFRNHVPPWQYAFMTLETLLLGIFATLAVRGGS